MSTSGDRVLLGRISGAHGIRGEVRLVSFTAEPENIAAYGILADIQGRSFEITELRRLKAGGAAFAARIKDVRDRNDAEALKCVELFVERTCLPEPEEDEWYYTDLIGLTALSEAGEEFGRIVAVQDFGAGDLLEIRQTGVKQTMLIPFTRSCVPVVNVSGGHVMVIPLEEVGSDDSGE